MQRVGFLLKVKEDRIDEYKAHHRNVSPDMLDALHRHGWNNYSLYMRDVWGRRNLSMADDDGAVL